MQSALPRYVLMSDSAGDQQGRWNFVLQSADGSRKLEASDIEPDTKRERLELLAVVRGLEALDQPSRVTIMTPSQYVRRGLAYGLEEWRSNGWTWEHFGQMVLVKNHDLWQRLDRALGIHQVECRTWRVDGAHTDAASEKRACPPPPSPRGQSTNDTLTRNDKRARNGTGARKGAETRIDKGVRHGMQRLCGLLRRRNAAPSRPALNSA
jgi:ribonuclease HI